MGSPPCWRRDRLCALDCLEGAQAGRPLEAPGSGQGARQPLRVALPRRSAAHGHKPLRAFPAARPPRHRRPLTGIAPLVAARDEGRIRLRARRRRRPHKARLRRAPLRRESRHRHRLRRTSARLLRKPRDHSETADDRQRLHLRAQPVAARAARSPRHPPPADTALPAAHQRKGRALHQTMAREWAYGLAYRTHRHRNAALPHWLDNYNRRRPHSSLADRPPLSRVHNLRG
jgi:hypothetical protein